jgi:manganese efflux pump family protein
LGFIEITIIAFGLSLDAFAVALCAGAGKKIKSPRGEFRLAFHFGLFQFLMPVLGWFLGIKIEPFIENIDHWIAFALLFFVGFKMIKESFRESETEECCDPSKGKNMVLLSIATSIDALVVGFSFSMLRIDIWYPGTIIGVITAIVSIIGIYAGKLLGTKIGPKMELLGGMVIVLIGVKILVSHLV